MNVYQAKFADKHHCFKFPKYNSTLKTRQRKSLGERNYIQFVFYASHTKLHEKLPQKYDDPQKKKCYKTNLQIGNI